MAFTLTIFSILLDIRKLHHLMTYTLQINTCATDSRTVLCHAIQIKNNSQTVKNHWKDESTNPSLKFQADQIRMPEKDFSLN